MKKYLAVLGLLFGLASLSHAGTPTDPVYPLQSPISNTSIYGSTWTTTGSTITIAATTFNSAGTSYSCRNCFTKFVVQLSTNSIFTVYDGTTTTAATVEHIEGFALAGSTSAGGSYTLSLPEDHLGPLCTTAGNITYLTIGSAGALTGSNNTINYEGYTNCGGTNNQGVMK